MNIFGFSDTNFSRVLGFFLGGGRGGFQCIEKHSSHGHALESSGTKIMMRGTIVCQLCKQKQTNKQTTNKQKNNKFLDCTSTSFFLTTLAKDSRHTWSLFGG